MFCEKCGTQVSDDTNFCPKCGHPQKGNSQIQASPTEYCEITFQRKLTPLTMSFQFWARATGTEGLYSAGETAALETTIFNMSNKETPNQKMHQSLHAELVRKLVQDGWKPTGKGKYWWQDKFQR